MSKRKKYRTDYPRWYGIYGIRFVWHGEWSEPEIIYHRYAMNEHCVEDGMIELYREEGGDDEDQEAWKKWMYDNRDRVREECQYVIDNRKDFGRYIHYVG